VDIHCHCLPGLDDGPRTMAESLDLCRRLVADGITTVVATPHQLGGYDGRNSATQIRAAVSELNDAVAAARIPLRVVCGADVRIDERIPEMLVKDEVMTLGDGRRFLLLELPREAQISPIGLARELNSDGITLILTHPERYRYLSQNPGTVFAWLAEGILLQLTAASVLGAFGSSAERACWYWLATGAASLVASDAHGRSRGPCMSQAFAAISRRLGPMVARHVCIDNPRRAFQGDEVLPPKANTHTEMQAWKQTPRTFWSRTCHRAVLTG